ncbi:hypothetical protein PoB_001623900 [Plakobranchus ocellatus]|uniref:Uncharacterized protein n=1 Tax=Plakobranchus ocellatus TaxID=259542 RepID=A0AAV3Z5R0_9GAST|nr:hypothetical protein PoB_001623900 [Plakobranchus ocellatus]
MAANGKVLETRGYTNTVTTTRLESTHTSFPLKSHDMQLYAPFLRAGVGREREKEKKQQDDKLKRGKEQKEEMILDEEEKEDDDDPEDNADDKEEEK